MKNLPNEVKMLFQKETGTLDPDFDIIMKKYCEVERYLNRINFTFNDYTNNSDDNYSNNSYDNSSNNSEVESINSIESQPNIRSKTGIGVENIRRSADLSIYRSYQP